MQPEEVHIKDETIKLGQFIKLANLVESGGEAKDAITNGDVTVNGEVDIRRGKTLRNGDVVCIGDDCAQATTGAVSDDDYFDEATANDDFDPEKWRNM
ncbi:RNA-binding S4 domain-containing protein [Corynebacterium crudilactis]|uniref:RNA-binding protein n=1 Tax=Corynebacterium crudilactis TaxID=1652495 RepID=A0A172QQE3_9CORY|nr:RNA-binding S4 domain-containing protein [Corynebacterium crudilactis]ANE02898.1 RNA-binding protein [Corynebacterium crudilactis]